MDGLLLILSTLLGLGLAASWGHCEYDGASGTQKPEDENTYPRESRPGTLQKERSRGWLKKVKRAA